MDLAQSLWEWERKNKHVGWHCDDWGYGDPFRFGFLWEVWEMTTWNVELLVGKEDLECPKNIPCPSPSVKHLIPFFVQAGLKLVWVCSISTSVNTVVIILNRICISTSGLTLVCINYSQIISTQPALSLCSNWAWGWGYFTDRHFTVQIHTSDSKGYVYVPWW